MERNRTVNNVIRYIWILVWVLFIFALILHFYPPIFPRVDDIKMRWIISGNYTGNSSPYVLFMKYPFAYILSLLYKVIPSVNWYGIVFIAIHAMSLYIIICECTKKYSNILLMIFSSALITIVFAYFDLENILQLEFTSLAALSGGIAIFILALTDITCAIRKNVVNWIIIIVFLCLCYCIRISVFKMVLPFYCVILVSKVIIVRKKMSFRAIFTSNRSLLVLIVAGVICLCGVKILNYIPYSSEEWENFKEYNSNRSGLYDYDDMIPPYDENIELYDSLGITKDTYNSIVDYNIGFSDSVSMDTINKLYAQGESTKERISIFDAVGNAYNALFDSEYALTTSILLTITVILFAILIYCKEGLDFLAYTICALGVLMESIYVGLGGRFPERVVMAIILIWASINAGFFTKILKKEKFVSIEFLSKFRLRKVEIFFLSIIIILVSAITADIKYLVLRENVNESQEKLYEIQGIKDYLSSNKDKFYFITTHLISRKYIESWNENIGYCNFQELGGWETFSPCFYEKMNRESVSSIEAALLEDRFYLITDEMYALEYMLNYYNQKYNGTITYNVEDTIYGNNAEYYVIKFQNNN